MLYYLAEFPFYSSRVMFLVKRYPYDMVFFNMYTHLYKRS